MTNERSSIILALGMGLLAGLLAALGLVLFSGSAAVAADEGDTPLGLLRGAELETEDVNPGVFRVVSDGVRNLSVPVAFHPHGDLLRNRVVVAPDESVWLFRDKEFFRLGETEVHSGLFWDSVDVDSEGNVWTIASKEAKKTYGCRTYGPPHLLMYDGQSWRAQLCDVVDFELHPDGSPWVVVEVDPGSGRYAFGRVRDGEWKKAREGKLRGWGAVPLPDGFRGFAMSPPGEAEARTKNADWDAGWLIDSAGELALIRLTSDGRFNMGGPNAEGEVVALGFAEDRSSWAYLGFEEAVVADGSLTTEPSYVLARYSPMPAGAGGYPELVGAYESELTSSRRLLNTCCGIAPRLDVAPDGSVWLPSDEGLARFDGQEWDWYLAGQVIEDVDIARDGTVWVQANDLEIGPGVAHWEQEGTTSTYVITPEAMAATE